MGELDRLAHAAQFPITKTRAYNASADVAVGALAMGATHSQMRSPLEKYYGKLAVKKTC